MSNISKQSLKLIRAYQQQEINGHYIYKFLSDWNKNPENSSILKKIADDELDHYITYKSYTGKKVNPQKIKILLYKIAAAILGPTFTIKLLEKNEIGAQEAYKKIKDVPEIGDIVQDEEKHEDALIGMIEEEKLNYMGSIVLGLNDALVELTGVLAGLTLALRDPNLIALTGSITGIAAAFSMAASEYLSTKSEDAGKGALKASFYTGLAYVFTVLVLILPFLFLKNVFVSLALTLTGAVGIIAAFNYYYAIVKDEKFSRRFTEMALLSFGVALFSFGIAFVLRKFFSIDV